MAAYQGGKKRLGYRIYSVIKLIEYDLTKKTACLPYFEPFIGMAGVMRYFAQETGKRELYASDYNENLILLWKAIQKGWKPPLKCTREEYDRLKTAKPSAKRAFIGIAASYGTVFFNGYRLHYNKDKDYLREASNGLLEIAPVMKRVDIMESSSYDEWTPNGYLIYCDPPYVKNKLKSKYFQDFDHEHFWKVMREWSKNNIVIVSETIAPRDFKKIWCANSNCSTRYNNKVYKDCLFIYKDLYDRLDSYTKRNIKKIV